jgi:hypothetical protein
VSGPLTIQGTRWATRPNLTTSFAAQGGTPPYAYSLGGGQPAGGSINASTGLYTAPARVPNDSRYFYDYPTVTDATGATAQTWISVCSFWQLIAEIFRHELALPLGRIFLFDQKVDLPTDERPFIVIAVPNLRMLGSGIKPNGVPGLNGQPGWDQTLKWAMINYSVDVHLYSRDMDALNRVPGLQVAATSLYSRQVQQENSFYLADLPTGVVNLSEVDGTAITYHYVFSFQAYYTNQWTTASEYFDEFQNVQLVPAVD